MNRAAWSLLSLVAVGFALPLGDLLRGADPPAPEARPDEGTDQPVLTDRLGDPLPAGALVRFGTHRLRQAESTAEVAFHPDGRLVAAIDGRGRVGLWDAATGKPVAGPAIDSSGDTFAFSPDGKWLATHEAGALGRDGGVRLWDLRGTDSLWLRNPLHFSLAKIAYSPCGRYVAAGGRGGALFLYHVKAGKAIVQLKGHRLSVTTLAFSPDGKLLASGEGSHYTANAPLLLWETESGRLLASLKGHTNYISAVAFSPDGKTLASSSLDKTLRFWDVATKRQLRKIGNEWGPVAFSPDGKLLASGTPDKRGGITLWDPATGRPLRTFARGVSIGDLAFSPDGKILLCCGYHDNHALRLWEVSTGNELLPFEGHRHAVVSLAFSPDGQTLATWGGDTTTRLWDVATARQRHHLSFRPGQAGGMRGGTYEGKARSVAFSPDGQTLACLGWTATNKPALFLCDVAEGHVGEPIPCGGIVPFALAFTPDSKTVAVATSGGAHLVDRVTGQQTSLPEAEPGVVQHGYYEQSLNVSPDGRTLAVAYTSSKIRLWDLPSRTPLRDIGPTSKVERVYCEFLAFSPDGAVLADCTSRSAGPGDPLVQLWEAASGKLIAEMVPRARYGVKCVAFSPDGRLLATAQDRENTAVLWDLATGQPLATLGGHQGEVLCLAFSPDGNTLATGSGDTTALLWDVRKYRPKPLPRPDADTLPQLWGQLRDDDPARAYPALWKLAGAGDDAVALLGKHLRPVPTPDRKRLQALLKDLGSDRFQVRDEARRGLLAMGEPAGPALRQLLEDKPSLEVRRLVEQVLEQIRAVAAHGLSLRELRAVSVLGQIGTAQARALLEELAKGADEATLTRRARVALRLPAGEGGKGHR
jgi:WD40 repeat protein